MSCLQFDRSIFDATFRGRAFSTGFDLVAGDLLKTSRLERLHTLRTATSFVLRCNAIIRELRNFRYNSMA